MVLDQRLHGRMPGPESMGGSWAAPVPQKERPPHISGVVNQRHTVFRTTRRRPVWSREVDADAL